MTCAGGFARAGWTTAPGTAPFSVPAVWGPLRGCICAPTHRSVTYSGPRGAMRGHRPLANARCMYTGHNGARGPEQAHKDSFCEMRSQNSSCEGQGGKACLKGAPAARVQRPFITKKDREAAHTTTLLARGSARENTHHRVRCNDLREGKRARDQGRPRAHAQICSICRPRAHARAFAGALCPSSPSRC